MILSLRTDNPQAEIALFDGQRLQASQRWHAHKKLSDTLLVEIKKLLSDSNKDWSDIKGIVFYSGPGSFTGLRIGAAAANALKTSLSISLVQCSGENWQSQGIEKLMNGKNENALPEYGSEVFTIKPRK